MAVEMQGVGLVDILFREVTETKIHPPLGETVRRIKLNERLRHRRYGVVVKVYVDRCTAGIGSFDVELLVLWVLKGEQRMQNSTFKRRNHGVGCPSYGLHIIRNGDG